MSKFKENLPLILAIVSAATLAAGLFLVESGKTPRPIGNDDITSPAQAASQPPQSEGAPAPEFDLKSLDGDRLKLADYKGKVLIVDFWSVTCGPCIEANRHLDRMYSDNRDKGLAVIGFSLDNDAGVVKQFLQRMPVRYPTALATSNLIKSYGGVFSIPQTFVIDKQGRIVKKYEGYSDLSAYQMERLVKKLLTD